MPKSRTILSTKISGSASQIGSNLKKSAWSAMIEALALIILGLLFVIWPDKMIQLAAYFIGVFFIVKGIYNMVVYYSEKGQNDFFNNGLLSATASILVGIIALVLGENIAGIFRIVVGIIIIYEALVRINAAMKLHSVGVASWRYTLGLALLMMALGVFITFYSGAVVTLIGWLMIATGVIAVIGDAMFVQHVNTVVDQFTKVREGKVVKDK